MSDNTILGTKPFSDYMSVVEAASKVMNLDEHCGICDEQGLKEEVTAIDYDRLKKGDIITIEFKSPMTSGKSKFKITAKNIVGKAKVGKITLQNMANPKGVKFFLYKRGNKVSLAQGDMAASVVKYTVEEKVEATRMPMQAPFILIDEGAVLDVGDVDKWMKEIEKGIDAPWIQVRKSALGGDENVTIMIKLSLDAEKDWNNKILHNSRYAMISLGANGKLEMFAKGRGLKNMRKTKFKTAKDAIGKINTWIKQVDEEVEIKETVSPLSGKPFEDLRSVADAALKIMTGQPQEVKEEEEEKEVTKEDQPQQLTE